MEKRYILEHYGELMELLNCIEVGVFITDEDGRTIFANDTSCTAGGLKRDEIIGKTVYELVASGYIENSITVKVLHSGEREEMIQNLGDGGQVYVTGIPYKNENGKTELVITTERDITETIRLQELLGQRTEKYETELEYLKKQNITMWGNLIAEDDVSKQLAAYALKIAKLDNTVLLTGESGTGKEVYANFLYENGDRVGKPFIKINCATIPESLIESELFGYEEGTFTGANKGGKAGIFEMANHGTLFLDEIGELPMHLQPKLLRVLQEKEIMRIGGNKTIPLDIRLITATNRDLKKQIEEGNFREDLYYRLNVMPIEIPPLRGRKKDIQKLTEYFLNVFNKEYYQNKLINPEAMRILQDGKWRGNVRELENLIERLVITAEKSMITESDVGSLIGETYGEVDRYEGRTYRELMDEFEKTMLETVLTKYGKASVVSRELEIDKATLHRRLKKYDLL